MLKHMKKIEAALFDVDGTLLNTAEFVYQACEYTFRVHRLPIRSRDEMALVMGKPLEECYRHLSPDGDPHQLCETHRSFQADNLHLSVPFRNTLETLRRLKEAGVKIAAITTRSKRTSIKTLEAGDIVSYFDVVISGEDVQNPKPHSEPLLKALQRLEIEPEKAVMIGDTESDVLAGKSAGLKTIGVSYGFLGSRIADSNPDFLVSDIADVVPIILSDT